MTDETLDLEADAVVSKWLKTEMAVIASVYDLAFSFDKVENNSDYQAMRRIFEYINGEEHDAPSD